MYYVVLVGLALAFELSPDSYWLLLLTSALGVCGLAVSIYLLHLSCNVLCIICPVCLALHLINFALLWLSLYITHMQVINVCACVRVRVQSTGVCKHIRTKVFDMIISMY